MDLCFFDTVSDRCTCINLLTGLKPDILLAHETEIIKAGVGKGGGEKPLNINEVCFKNVFKKILL